MKRWIAVCLLLLTGCRAASVAYAPHNPTAAPSVGVTVQAVPGPQGWALRVGAQGAYQTEHGTYLFQVGP